MKKITHIQWRLIGVPTGSPHTIIVGNAYFVNSDGVVDFSVWNISDSYGSPNINGTDYASSLDLDGWTFIGWASTTVPTADVIFLFSIKLSKDW